MLILRVVCLLLRLYVVVVFVCVLLGCRCALSVSVVVAVFDLIGVVIVRCCCAFVTCVVGFVAIGWC